MAFHRHNFGPWVSEFRDNVYETDRAKIVTQDRYNIRSCQDESCLFVESKKADDR